VLTSTIIILPVMITPTPGSSVGMGPQASVPVNELPRTQLWFDYQSLEKTELGSAPLPGASCSITHTVAPAHLLTEKLVIAKDLTHWEMLSDSTLKSHRICAKRSMPLLSLDLMNPFEERYFLSNSIHLQLCQMNVSSRSPWEMYQKSVWQTAVLK
jgi:hypothetical protein